MIGMLKRLFCRHDYIVRFRGQFTKGVECSLCGNAALLDNYNSKPEREGWICDFNQP